MAALGGMLATSARNRERRVRAGAAAGSVVVHVLLLMAFLSSTTSGVFEGGAGGAGGGGQAVTVSLVGPVGRTGEDRDANSSARSRIASQIDELQQQMQPDKPTIVTNRQRVEGTLSQLLKELAQSRSAAGAGDANGRSGQGDNGDAEQSARAQGQQVLGKAVQGLAADRGDMGRATGDMWGRIETCWRPEAAVVVTLEVVIDSSGRLALPPRILRPDGARLDERRLIAEARAIQAVAACAPFRSGAPLFGKKTYRFAFAAKP